MSTQPTLTPADAMDIFAELPRDVRVSVLSVMVSLRKTWRVAFHDYPQAVAQYIEASGLLNVSYSHIGNFYGATFRANDLTAVLRENWRACLEMTGFEF